MEFFNVRFFTPGFHTYFGWATIRKWTKGEMILKAVITATGFEKHSQFQK